jgi:hypothetical protein
LSKKTARWKHSVFLAEGMALRTDVWTKRWQISRSFN